MVADAVADGRYDIAEAARTAYTSIAVGEADEVGPELAASAAGKALRDGAYTSADITAVFVASASPSPMDVWNPATYVQRRTGCTGFAAAVTGGCAVAMVCLDSACRHLTAEPRQRAALVCAGESWPASRVDRWRMRSGLVFANGGSAIVIGRDPGVAEILTVVTTSNPGLEGMHRAGESWYPAAVDLERRAVKFMATTPKGEVKRQLADGLRAAVTQATDEAGMGLDEARAVVLPGLGRKMLESDYARPLGISLEKTSWVCAAQWGHFGTADQFAAIDYLVKEGRVTRGDRVVVVGEGAGFQWSVAVMAVL